MITPRAALRRLVMAGGWHVPLPGSMTPGQPVVLTYHGVPEERDARGLCRQVFEDHVRFLTHHFEMVGAPALGQPAREPGRLQVLLTFDDGFRNHAELVAPILRRHRVPALFFVPTRHTEPGRYLWFTYLRMLGQWFPGAGFMFRGEFMDMSPGVRPVTMRTLEARLLSLTPHPTAMYDAIDKELPRLEDYVERGRLDDQAAGMTVEQIGELAADPLFEVGAHTTDHPLLTRCDPDEQRRQIADNKTWLERLCGRPCEAIAYPGSDYDESVLRICRDAGFGAGYGDSKGRGLDPELEWPRVGIYYPSLAELGNKVRWSRAIAYWSGGRAQQWPAGQSETSTIGSRHA